MNSILQNIIKEKKERIEAIKKTVPIEELKAKAASAPKRISFKKALESKNNINIIAEIKKATPALGVIAKDFDPAIISKEYEKGGAAAISVLTEEKYFLGDLSHISIVRESTKLPILNKDFILDPYQIYQGFLAGADAVLLIAVILDHGTLKEFLKLSKSLGMDSLVEIHTEEELKKALGSGADIIGINNRNLDTFEIDLETSKKLYPKVPAGKITIAESGIKTSKDIKELNEIGINSFLIGNSLMISRNIVETLKSLRSVK